MDRDGDGLFLADQHDEPLASGDAGIEQVPLQHGIVLGHDGNDHRWVFRALALVEANHGHRAGRNDVGDDLPRPNRGQLVDIAHGQHGGLAGHRLEQRLHQQNIDHAGFVDDDVFETGGRAPFRMVCA
jgi:hypothetical protein